MSPVPSPRIREAYRAAVDAGAHAVIGHHPHVIQGVETYHGAPIFYSLGNFCFDSDYVAAYPGWDRGLIATLKISRSGVSGYELHPIGIRQGERVDLLQGEERRESLAQVEALSALLNNEGGWRDAWQQFVLWRAEKDYLPTFNDLAERLSKPEGRQMARIAANYFQCPTHQELMSTYFSMKANS